MSEEFDVILVGAGWREGFRGLPGKARIGPGGVVQLLTKSSGWIRASLAPGHRLEVRAASTMSPHDQSSARSGTLRPVEPDAVNHPEHYNVGPKCECGRVIECITVVRDKLFSVGNAMKYLWRAGEKAEAGLSALEKERQDLAKAEWYCRDRGEELDNLIAEEKKNADRD